MTQKLPFMRSTALLLALFAACSSAVANDWNYSKSVDAFDNVTISRASLRGGNVGSSLVYEERSDGKSFIAVTGGDFLCFPGCEVRVKFDQEAPLVVNAHAPSTISAVLFLADVLDLKPRITAAQSIIVRAKLHRDWRDIEFKPKSQLDTSKFSAATSGKDKAKRCQDNAVTEDYQVCMAR